MSEFLSAIRERRESSAKNPSRQPAFRRLEALESLDCFQSSVELFVVAFNEVRGPRTTIMEKLLCCDVTREQIAVVEDVLERCDLQGIIIVARSAPADMAFQIRLAEVRKIEDLFLEIREEVPVGLLASHFERSSDVLEEMDMAELDDCVGVDLFRCHADGFVVVADKSLQVVAGVLQFGEELYEGLIILAWSEHANGNVMRQVIDAVDEGNLPIVAFDRHVLSIHHEEAAEALRIAIAKRDLVVVREML